MTLFRSAGLILLSLVWMVPLGRVAAQAPPLALNEAAASLDEAAVLASSALARGRYAVVIDLDDNELSFRQGEHVLWTAPIATGTGFQLEASHRSWDFSTPNGTFQIEFKELDPVWIAPNWFFVENGLPVPPPNDSRRYFPGGLGAAAVYIGPDLAIHGTDKPELLGQRVSHGCIRLSNEYALRLFHDVQVGTQVIILGGKDVERKTVRPGDEVSTFTPKERSTSRSDPLLTGWKEMPSEDLLAVLANEVWLDPAISRWTEVMGILLERGVGDEGDNVALEGLLAGAAALPDAGIEREYSLFLVDAYVRSPMRVLSVLSRVDDDAREVAASLIVKASLELYHGSFTDPAAPWPTSRVPRTLLSSDQEAGWDALAAAESDYR